MRVGYKLSSEGCGPKELIRQAVRAEQVGSDFVEIHLRLEDARDTLAGRLRALG